jgi:Fur family ferric uptake transcriptional regulator
MQGPAQAPVDDQLIMPICAIFRRFLKRQGLKFTTERALILDGVLAEPGVFEAEALLDKMRASGAQVSKATIYRTLKHLLEANIVREVLIDAGRAHYELSFGRAPKGHLVCVETDRIVEFPTQQLDELMKTICEEHGFEGVSHRFVIYGISPEAQKAEQAEQAEEEI